MDSKPKSIVLVIIIVAVIIVAVGFWYWYQKMAGVTEETGLFEAVENPMKKLPETNPFRVQSNPFSADVNPVSWLNPFNEAYKNPFER